MVTPDRYVKLKKNVKNGFLILSYYFLLLAIEVGRKRKFVHKAEVESLAAASYKDSNSLSKEKWLQLKQGSQANFVHVFCTHLSSQQEGDIGIFGFAVLAIF